MEPVTKKDFIISKILGRKVVKLRRGEIVYGLVQNSFWYSSPGWGIQIVQLRSACKKLHTFFFCQGTFCFLLARDENESVFHQECRSAFDFAFNKQIQQGQRWTNWYNLQSMVLQGDVWNNAVFWMIKLSHLDISELNPVMLLAYLCYILDGQKGKENKGNQKSSMQQAELLAYYKDLLYCFIFKHATISWNIKHYRSKFMIQSSDSMMCQANIVSQSFIAE